ncbi:hypothetical protein GCM10027199_48000 [Amycolatopsis magusensis]
MIKPAGPPAQLTNTHTGEKAPTQGRARGTSREAGMDTQGFHESSHSGGGIRQGCMVLSGLVPGRRRWMAMIEIVLVKRTDATHHVYCADNS